MVKTAGNSHSLSPKVTAPIFDSTICPEMSVKTHMGIIRLILLDNTPQIVLD